MTAPAPASAPVHDRTHIDWLTVTHDDGEPLRSILRGPTEVLSRAPSTYKHGIQDGYGAKFYAGGQKPRPFMLVMSGKALSAWRTEYDDESRIHRLAFDGVHCTRLDLARTTSGAWTPYRLRAMIEDERVLTTWRTTKYTCANGDNALTVQLGSRQSNVMLRTYDKRAELLAKGETCPFPRLSRWELEIKGDLAPVAFHQLSLLFSGVNLATGEERWPLERIHAAWLSKRVTVTTEPVDRVNKNQARATADPAWEEFLNVIEELRLAADLDERGSEALARSFGTWAKRSLAPSLATLEDLGGPGTLATLVEHGRERQSARHAAFFEHIDEARAGLLSGLEA